MVKTSLVERKPYVLETPIGSQITLRRKSTIKTMTPDLKIPEYIFGGKQLMATDRMRRPSEIAQMRARHFKLLFSAPPGKDTSHTAS
jgi:hypothetical protein